MSKYEVISIIIKSLSIIVVSISVLLLYIQMRKNYLWNRMKESQNLLFRLVSGDLYQIRKNLEHEYGVDIFSGSQNINNVFQTISDDKDRRDFKFLVRAIYNFFEIISIGMKNNILEESICYDYLCLILVRYKEWGDIYIKELQSSDPTTWIEFTNYYDRWKSLKNNETKLLIRKGIDKL